MNKIATVAISALLGATIYTSQADAALVTLNPSASNGPLSAQDVVPDRQRHDREQRRRDVR